MPDMVDTTVAISEGIIIAEGAELPCVPISAITVAGKSWIEVAFITKNIIIFLLADSEPVSIAEIAFIPAGVAAPPIPSILDARFTAI